MDRSSKLAAVLIATVLVLSAAPAASAEGESTVADGAATIAVDPAPVETPALEDAQPAVAGPQEATPAGSTDAPAAPADTSAPPPVVPEPEVTPPPESPAGPVEVAEPPASSPAEPSREAVTGGGSFSAPKSTGSGDSSSKPARPTVASPARAGVDSLPRLEQVLPSVERDLGAIKADAEAIRRQLDSGAAPPASRLNRLRSQLEQLTPVLEALDAQPAGWGLDKQLLRVRLAETQVAVARLAVSLRDSGLRGPALGALLTELERFGALGPGFGLPPGPASFAPAALLSEQAAPVTPAVEQAYAGSSSKADAVPAERRNAAAAVSHSSEADGQHAPEPWSSGSATSAASPGGALAGAGMALLAALLIGLCIPRLLSRLELATRRGHAVSLVLALERPD